MGVLVMALMFFALQGLGTGITSIGAVVAGVFFALTVFRLALESVAWTKALEGGRRTAAYLEPLLGRGFVVLHNRQIPGRSNLARLLLDRPRVLNDEDVQQLARVADERLRPTYAWERG